MALGAWGALVSAGLAGRALGGPPEGEGRGEGEPAPPAAETALPRPEAPIRPVYPEGATGDVDVGLEVELGADGTVRAVRVVDGEPPFSTVAMAAVASARFEPARKGGRAVASRFLLQVRVAQPAPAPPAGQPEPVRAPAAPSAPAAAARPSAPAAAARPSAPAAAARPAAPVIDVTVVAERPPARSPDIGGTHLSQDAVARVPGAFGDAFRAVEILPGVVPHVSGLPLFFVRGATPTTTGYFLDGIPVPLLFHVGAGPAVIAPQLVGSVDFHPGGYPVAFGRQIGGVVAARSAEPPPRFSAEATLRLIDAGAYATAPLPGDRGAAFAAARFSFTQAVVPLITPDVSFGYVDYQVGASYRPTRADRVRVLAFGADDFLTQRRGGAERKIYAAQFHRVDVAYERGGDERARPALTGSLLGGDGEGDRDGAARREAEGGAGTRVRVAATLGVDRTHLVGQGDLAAVLGQVRALAEVPLHPMVRVRAGADLLAEDRDLTRLPPGLIPPGDDGSFAETFADRTVGTFGAFADVGFTPRPFVDLVAGVRADFFGDPAGGAVGVDPRAAARIGLTPWLTSVTTFGLAHQRPSFVLPVPGVVPADRKLVLQEALHASQSFELRLPLRTTAQVTGFVHAYSDLTDYLATCGPGAFGCRFFARASGRAHGLELAVQRALTERLGGQLSYTLSRSERTVEGETFAADSDRTHVVHLVLGYEPAPGWHAAARVTALSGRPFSLSAGKRNVPRAPGFFRLDVRLSKTWRIGRRAHVTAVLEGLNVTLSKETVDLDCRSPIQIGQTCGLQEIGPITLPSVGITAGF